VLISFTMYLFLLVFFLVCLFLTAGFWRNKDAYIIYCETVGRTGMLHSLTSWSALSQRLTYVK